MSEQLNGQHYIDGHWTATGGKSFTAFNPATGQSLEPSFAEATQIEVDSAAHAAESVQHALSERSHRWAADLLDAIAGQIEALGDNLLERAEAETALPRARLIGERARTCFQLRMFADMVREGSWVEAVIDQADPDRQPVPKPDLRRMLIPRGLIAVFSASNFPFAFGACGGDVASALAAGNPVIVKGHPSHPGISELFALAVGKALSECNLPSGLFALLQGRRNEVGELLVQHPVVQAVGFTGSQRAGRALFNLASQRESPIPVFAEMGSVNPVVILPAALRERAPQIAQDLAASVLLGGGQFCTKPGVIFVVGDERRQLGQALATQVQSAAPAVMLNQPIRNAFAARTAEMASTAGVMALVSGHSAGFAQQSPMILAAPAEVFLREPKLHEEAFGPGVLVIDCDSVGQAIECIQSLGGNLTGTVHAGDSDDPSLIRLVMHALESIAGRVILNGYPTGVEVGRAIVHGGPYPATTDSSTTSVGAAAIRRFVRPVAYQNVSQNLLPLALRDDNPLGIIRLVDGRLTSEAIKTSAH